MGKHPGVAFAFMLRVQPSTASPASRPALRPRFEPLVLLLGLVLLPMAGCVDWSKVGGEQDDDEGLPGLDRGELTEISQSEGDARGATWTGSYVPWLALRDCDCPVFEGVDAIEGWLNATEIEDDRLLDDQVIIDDGTPIWDPCGWPLANLADRGPERVETDVQVMHADGRIWFDLPVGYSGAADADGRVELAGLAKLGLAPPQHVEILSKTTGQFSGGKGQRNFQGHILLGLELDLPDLAVTCTVTGELELHERSTTE